MSFLGQKRNSCLGRAVDHQLLDKRKLDPKRCGAVYPIFAGESASTSPPTSASHQVSDRSASRLHIGPTLLLQLHYTHDSGFHDLRL